MRILEKIKIDENLLDEIHKHFTLKIIKAKTHLFYQGQIPIAGFFLLKGSVEIYKNKKNKKILKDGAFFGISECLEKCPVNVNAEILPESEIFLLDQSTMLELLEDKKNNLLADNLFKLLTPKRVGNE